MADLVTLTDPRSSASEAYRTLRTNLIFGDNPPHTLLVTSPSADEGKSTAVANLAVTFAQSGRSTILVDCDLRRPQQHTIWRLNQASGLTAGAEPQETSVDNLRVLTSGSSIENPADFIGSADMESLIVRLREEADIVLFDAPPVLAVTDATLLGAKLDATLLVLQANRTRRAHAEEAKQHLERVHARIIGAVLLNVKSAMQTY